MTDAEKRIRELEQQLKQRSTQLAAAHAEIAALKAELEQLRAALGQNSSNSHKPPSSDSPKEKDQRNASRGQRRDRRRRRKRGGQPGHPGHQRQLLPTDQVDQVVQHFPKHCERCGAALPRQPATDPLRHQVAELPVVSPYVTEHQLHAVQCTGCAHTTPARLPAAVPVSAFGPRLTAVMAMLTGIYHLSRRRAVQLLWDLLGVQVSAGGLSRVEQRVSEALKGATDEEAFDYALAQQVKHIDATSWRQQGKTLSLWTIATTLVTVFRITLDGTKEAVQQLLAKARGILVSDRAKVFGFWHMADRQVCWAHLLRKFIAYAQMSHPTAQRLGEQLVEQTSRLFEYWYRVRDGTLASSTYRRYMRAVQGHTEYLLRLGEASAVKGLAGSCKDILAHREALWTFVHDPEVCPTNNFAERELRRLVLWRKTSFGTQSERGSLFATRMATVEHSLRAQRRDVLTFLTDTCQAAVLGGSAPSLLPQAI